MTVPWGYIRDDNQKTNLDSQGDQVQQLHT